MTGPPPKDPAARKRRNAPKIGEFVNAPAVGWQHGRRPRAPNGLMPETLKAWDTWTSAWFAAFWTPDDVPGLRHMIRLYDKVERDEMRWAAELMRYMDAYGVTPKGQVMRRWRPPETDQGTTATKPKATGSYGKLKAVE